MMLSRAACMIAVCGACIAPPAGAAPWVLDPATTIGVDVAWEGAVVTVRFPPPTGSVDFDPAHPERARATVTVPAAEATAGSPIVDALVRGPEYLGAAQWPEIDFRLTGLRQTSKQTADLTGEMTLRGVTRPVAFAAQVIRYGPAAADPSRFEAGFDLTGRIDRTDFGSTGGLPEVAAVLPVHIRLLMHSE